MLSIAKKLIVRYKLRCLLFAFIFPLLPFYLLLAYNKFVKRIEKSKDGKTLFFLFRDEHGAILNLLYYVRCWTDVRNPAVIAILTPKIEIVEELVAGINSSETVVISLNGFIIKLIHAIFDEYFSRQFIFNPLYCLLIRNFPDAVYIYENSSMSKSNKGRYIKYLDNVFCEYGENNDPFWNAYELACKVLDYRKNIYLDFARLYSQSRPRLQLDNVWKQELCDKLGINNKYVTLNINSKKYHYDSRNIRRVVNCAVYNVLIDYLIAKGLIVVLQGSVEQPVFSARKGFVDYSKSDLSSPGNDLLLFSGCEFFVSSKTGAEGYGLVCDKPILGLNYTELISMTFYQRLRFFPKRIRDENGNFLTWRQYLRHPIYYYIGDNYPIEQEFEFVEMSENEIVSSVDEFLQLLPLPHAEWLNYTPDQKAFKKELHPGHVDLFYIPGVPCDTYLRINQ